MKKNENGLSLEIIGGSESFTLQTSSLAQLIGLFQKRIEEQARNAQVIDTGNMLSDDNFKQTITEKKDLTIVDFFMVNYARFVNKGVKGKDSSKNAPNSPYKFKSYGMSEEGRKSILNSVVSGKMKISDISKTKYGRIKLETKAQKTENQADINQREANQIIYLIKKFGIKETGFIDKAAKDFSKDISKNMAEIAGKKIVYNMYLNFGK